MLAADGRTHWITPRDDQAKAKRKGRLQTYWLNPGRSKPDNSTSTSKSTTSSLCLDSSNNIIATAVANDNVTQDRLVDWMVEMLLHHVKQMVSFPS